jgi:hypothetical protein
MTSNETHGKFEDILAIATPELQPVCESLRRLIASLDSACIEVVWPKQKIASFGAGPKKMTEHYAYIAVQGSHINLGFYHGASLADPERLLEGTGKELRHVKLRNVGATKSAAIIALLRQAIIERKRYASEA